MLRKRRQLLKEVIIRIESRVKMRMRTIQIVTRRMQKRINWMVTRKLKERLKAVERSAKERCRYLSKLW